MCICILTEDSVCFKALSRKLCYNDVVIVRTLFIFVEAMISSSQVLDRCVMTSKVLVLKSDLFFLKTV